jgi:hypothetical protein
MYAHFILTGVLALCVMAGLWYRVTSILFFLSFTYVFLLDMTQYLNHFYLISLISFLMIFIPAHHMLSIDAYRKPKLRAVTTPAWTLWLLRIQLGVAYFYGGIAKINGDWLRGEPMRQWLAESTYFPIIGHLFTEEWMVYAFSYAGLLLDLLIVPFLIWKRTYFYACLFGLMFHVMNSQLFSIGIFPWFMIAATLVLYYPHPWPSPRKIWIPRGRRPARKTQLTRPDWITLGLLGVYMAIQLLMPFRHFLYPGNVNWTEEGHNFSWHMKLRDKEGDVWFYARDPESGQTWKEDPLHYLTRRQFGKMANRPDMILQFAHYLADEYRKKGYEKIEIYAEAEASLNGREKQWLIDPKANLAAQNRSLAIAPWIVPLTTPLPDPGVNRSASSDRDNLEE